MKQWRKIIIFASTLVVLIAVLIVGTKLDKSGNTESDVTPTPGPDPVVDLDEKDIAGIRIENTSGILELKATLTQTVSSASGTSGLIGSSASASETVAETVEWSLVEPAGIKYSASELKSKAGDFLDISATAEVSANAEDVSEYGLDKPSAKVIITKKSGDTITVLYGNKTVGDSGYYVMLDGTARVCTVGSVYGDAAMISVLDILDTSIFNGIVLADLTELGFERAKDSLNITSVSNLDADTENGTPATWRITSPIKVDASSDGYPSFLNEILAFSPSSFVKLHPDNLGEYGLDKPDYKVILKTASKEVRLVIGGDAGSGSKYGYTDYIDAVFVLNASLFSYIDKPVTELIDSFVTMTSIWDVSRIDIRIDSENIVCGVEDTQDSADESNFTVNGKDANVVNSSDDSYFRNFYQSLISVFIKGIDPEAKPAYGEDVLIKFTMKEDKSVVTFAYARRDDATYYVFKNGVYCGYYVNKDDFYSEKSGDEGILPSYRILLKAIENQKDGVYE